MRDETLMRRALALAARAIGNTSPNPMVGAVIADPDGREIAAGYHERAGAAHAETVVLEKAGEAARGATLYVTLEPCDHHGRTPPCTEAIIRAGVSRVVVALQDADERVRGAGVARLRDAGMRVDVGVCEREAFALNRRYFHHRRTGRPYVTLKMAQGLDGAVGPSVRERTTLTGPQAAAHVRSLRYANDAVMIGAETAIVDDPLLTVRPFRKRHVRYERIVVDSNARLPLSAHLVKDQGRAHTIVAVAPHAPADALEALRARGVEVIECAPDGADRIDLRDLLARLGARGMLGVLCEGGPTLGRAFLDAGLVDELHVLIAPAVFGSGATALRAQRLDLEIGSVRRLGDDVLIVAHLGAVDPQGRGLRPQ